MKPVGGYVLVDFDGIDINVNKGASTPVTVPKSTVEKLRQFNKPVCIEHTEITVDGGSVEMQGFTVHTRSAGVHQHEFANMRISVTGDTQVTFTLV